MNDDLMQELQDLPDGLIDGMYEDEPAEVME